MRHLALIALTLAFIPVSPPPTCIHWGHHTYCFPTNPSGNHDERTVPPCNLPNPTVC